MKSLLSLAAVLGHNGGRGAVEREREKRRERKEEEEEEEKEREGERGGEEEKHYMALVLQVVKSYF